MFSVTHVYLHFILEQFAIVWQFTSKTVIRFPKYFSYQLHLEKYQAYRWWSTFKVAGVSCKLNFQSARDQGIYVHNSLCQFYLTFVQHSTVQSQPYFCFIVRMNEQSKTFVAFVLYGKKSCFLAMSPSVYLWRVLWWIVNQREQMPYVQLWNYKSNCAI